MTKYTPPITDVIEISAESVIMNTSGEGIHWEAPPRHIRDEDDLDEQFTF